MTVVLRRDALKTAAASAVLPVSAVCGWNAASCWIVLFCRIFHPCAHFRDLVAVLSDKTVTYASVNAVNVYG